MMSLSSPLIQYTVDRRDFPTYPFLLELAQSRLQLGSVLHSQLGVGVFAQRVITDGQGRLGRQHSGDLALVFRRGLAHQGSVVDQPVFGRVPSGL